MLNTLVKKAEKPLIMATHSREVIRKADRIVSIHNKSLVNVDD